MPSRVRLRATRRLDDRRSSPGTAGAAALPPGNSFGPPTAGTEPGTRVDAVSIGSEVAPELDATDSHRASCPSPLPAARDGPAQSEAAARGLAAVPARPSAPKPCRRTIPRCQVEGCTADLSAARPYHQRYRICPDHVKEPCMTIGGAPMRFCQLCGKFQDAAEFDGTKRTCRRKLATHNARRRKREPEPDEAAAAARRPGTCKAEASSSGTTAVGPKKPRPDAKGADGAEAEAEAKVEARPPPSAPAPERAVDGPPSPPFRAPLPSPVLVVDGSTASPLLASSSCGPTPAPSAQVAASPTREPPSAGEAPPTPPEVSDGRGCRRALDLASARTRASTEAPSAGLDAASRVDSEGTARAGEAPTSEGTARAGEAPTSEGTARAGEAPTSEGTARAGEAPTSEGTARAGEAPTSDALATTGGAPAPDVLTGADGELERAGALVAGLEPSPAAVAARLEASLAPRPPSPPAYDAACAEPAGPAPPALLRDDAPSPSSTPLRSCGDGAGSPARSALAVPAPPLHAALVIPPPPPHTLLSAAAGREGAARGSSLATGVASVDCIPLRPVFPPFLNSNLASRHLPFTPRTHLAGRSVDAAASGSTAREAEGLAEGGERGAGFALSEEGPSGGVATTAARSAATCVADEPPLVPQEDLAAPPSASTPDPVAAAASALAPAPASRHAPLDACLVPPPLPAQEPAAFPWHSAPYVACLPPAQPADELSPRPSARSLRVETEEGAGPFGGSPPPLSPCLSAHDPWAVPLSIPPLRLLRGAGARDARGDEPADDDRDGTHRAWVDAYASSVDDAWQTASFAEPPAKGLCPRDSGDSSGGSSHFPAPLAERRAEAARAALDATRASSASDLASCAAARPGAPASDPSADPWTGLRRPDATDGAELGVPRHLSLASTAPLSASARPFPEATRLDAPARPATALQSPNVDAAALPPVARSHPSASSLAGGAHDPGAPPAVPAAFPHTCFGQLTVSLPPHRGLAMLPPRSSDGADAGTPSARETSTRLESSRGFESASTRSHVPSFVGGAPPVGHCAIPPPFQRPSPSPFQQAAGPVFASPPHQPPPAPAMALATPFSPAYDTASLRAGCDTRDELAAAYAFAATAHPRPLLPRCHASDGALHERARIASLGHGPTSDGAWRGSPDAFFGRDVDAGGAWRGSFPPAPFDRCSPPLAGLPDACGSFSAAQPDARGRYPTDATLVVSPPGALERSLDARRALAHGLAPARSPFDSRPSSNEPTNLPPAPCCGLADASPLCALRPTFPIAFPSSHVQRSAVGLGVSTPFPAPALPEQGDRAVSLGTGDAPAAVFATDVRVGSASDGFFDSAAAAHGAYVHHVEATLFAAPPPTSAPLSVSSRLPTPTHQSVGSRLPTPTPQPTASRPSAWWATTLPSPSSRTSPAATYPPPPSQRADVTSCALPTAPRVFPTATASQQAPQTSPPAIPPMCNPALAAYPPLPPETSLAVTYASQPQFASPKPAAYPSWQCSFDYAPSERLVSPPPAVAQAPGLEAAFPRP